MTHMIQGTLCFAFLLGIVIACDIAAAAEPTNHYLYREILIPADRIEEFVDGYIPKLRQEFEDLVRQSQGASLESIEPEFAAATFTATLVDERQLSGQAKLKQSPIDLRHLRTAAAESDERQAEPWTNTPLPDRLLTLDGNLPMQNPRWLRGAEQRAAIWGTDGQRTMILADPQASTVEFDWSLRGQRRNGSVRFHLEMPRALIHRVELTLPSDRALRSDRGMVTRRDDPSNQLSVWSIELGGQRSLNVTVQKAADELNVTSGPTYKQRSSYELSTNGVVLRSLLTVDWSEDGLAQIHATVDPGLTVTRVARDGKSLRWSRTRGVDGEALLIDVPEAEKQDSPARLSIPIQIEATGPVPWQQLFKLPRVRIESASWAADSLRLVVRDPLELTDLRMQDCFCAKIDPSAMGTPPMEAFDLIMESPSAVVELQVRKRPIRPGAEIGTLLELTDTTVQASAEVRFQPPLGELFEIAARIAPGWNVESVDAVAATDVEVSEASPVMDRWEYQDGTLAVRLRQSANWGHPVILQVTLHREASLLDRTAPVDQFIPLTVPSDAKVPMWIAIHATPAFQLEMENIGGGSWLLDAELPDWLRKRWTLSESATLLRVDESSIGVMLGVRRAVAPLQVATHTELLLSEPTLRQLVNLHVDPLGHQLSRFEVSFSQPLPTDPQWLLNGNPDGVVVRKIPPAREASPWAMNRYEIILSPGHDQPFEVRTEFGFSGGSPWNVPLVAVRSSNRQNGTIGVRGESGLAVEVDRVDGLQPMPLMAIDSDRWNGRDLRAAFRYNDTSTSIPTLVLKRVADTSHQPCWAWRCDLRSYYAAQGRPRHRVDYFLQNMGARTFEVQLPVGYKLDRVEVDGAKTEPLVTTDDGLSIPLPFRQPYPCLSIQYSLPEQSLGAIDWLTPPFPLTGAPILQETWHVWLPPGFQVYASQDEAADEDRWTARLFGRLAQKSPHGQLSLLQSLQRRLFSAERDWQPVVRQFESLLGAPQLSDGNSVTEQTEHAGNDEGRGEMRAASEVTWASRLTEIQNTITRSRPQFRLLIDRVELRRLGVLATSPLPRSRRSQNRQVGLDRLKQAGLGLLVQDDIVILSSASEVRRRANRADLIDGVATVAGTTWLVTARAQTPDQWMRDRAQLLWRPSTDALENSLQQAGWISHRAVLSGSRDKLKIYHHDTIVAMSAIVFLAAVAIGWWLVNWNHRSWFTFVACAVVLALLLPQPGATLAMAAAWAGLVGLLLRFIVVPPMGVESLDSPSPVSLKTSKAVMGICALVFAMGPISHHLGAQVQAPAAKESPSVSQASTSPPSPPNDGARASESAELPSVIYPVYVPSDGRREPQGTVVYLPRQFYQLLHANHAARKQPAYLMTSGVYRGAWPRRRDPTSLRITASYRITTFRSKVHVPLHNFGASVTLDKSSVRVNRQRAPVNTDGNGRLTVLLARPGEYQLTLDLLSVVQKRFEQQSLRMRIPPLMQSRLELTLPRDMQAAEVPSAWGHTKVDLRRGTVSAQLGPTSELFIRAHGSVDANDEEGVEQLIWLELTPDEARLETTFQFAGAPVPLRLKVDPRLRFVPNDEIDALSVFDWDAEKSELMIRAGEDQPPPTAHFALPHASAPFIGRFRVPQLWVEDVPVRQRWFAISVAASLSLDVPEETTLVSQNQFLETWRYKKDSPDYVWDDFQYPLTLVVRTAPHPTTWTSDTSFVFRGSGARFLVTAELDVGSRAATTQRFIVPEQLTVENITSTSGETRWHIGDDGNLILFFLEPATGLTQVTIQGELRDAVADDAIELPLITAENATHVPRVMRLFRSPGTDLEIVRDAGFVRAADDVVSANALDTIPTLDRLVGSWSPSPAVAGSHESTMAVRVSRTPARVTGRLVTQLDRDADGWSVEVRAQLATPRGRIDVVQFDVPQGFETENDDDDVRLEVRRGPWADRRIIDAWLPPSDEKRRSLTLRMRIPVPAQEGVSLPRINMLDVKTVQHDILLPTRGFVGDEISGEESTYAWSTEGLQTLLDEDEFVPAGYVGYRVIRSEYLAMLRPVEAVDRQPRIHLVHTNIEWTAMGHFVGLATFDLQPANLPTCTLQIPPNCQLVQVLVDGNRTMAREIDPNTVADPRADTPMWHIQLGSAPWPQRLQVMYQGRCEVANNSRVTLYAPCLRKGTGEPIPVSHSTWSVYAPSIAGVGAPHNVAVVENPRYEDETILRSLGALLDDAQLLVRDSPREDITAWFAPWARRSQVVLDRLRDPNSTDDDPDQQQIRQLEADFRIPVSQLGMLEPLDRPYDLAGELEQQDVWRESQWHDGSLLRCVASSVAGDSLPQLSVEYPQLTLQASHARFVAAAIVAGMVLFVPWWWPTRDGALLFRRYPHVVGVLLGLAWWFVLSPRWMGLLIVVVVLAIWTYGTLRQRRLFLPRRAS